MVFVRGRLPQFDTPNLGIIDAQMADGQGILGGVRPSHLLSWQALEPNKSRSLAQAAACPRTTRSTVAASMVSSRSSVLASASNSLRRSRRHASPAAVGC